MTDRCGSPVRMQLAFVVAILAISSPAGTRTSAAQSSGAATRAAGEQYSAGAVHRWLFGPHYRDLWTTPVTVPVLELSDFAGGLTPLRRGGGLQTASLRFAGANGREYAFRLVDKDPSAILDPQLRGTFVQEIVQDQISAAHPYGALVAAPLLEAAGVLHPVPSLYVLPDDPALGEFREQFGGALGMIEERPDENESGIASFHGADLVIGSERLFERVEEDPDDRVSSRRFLAARLLDVFLGDWDRHRDQWRWARFDGDRDGWQPIARDRDQAFVRFDGLLLAIASIYFPGFVVFDEDYPHILRLHWNAREVDRRFLTDLERPTWDSVASALTAKLSDEVIEQAVRALPAEIYALNGEFLTSALKRRRDALPSAATELYELLAAEVDVHGTDEDEHVRIVVLDDGGLEVAVSEDPNGDETFYRRRFHRSETDEIRLYLRGGDDRVSVEGAGPTGITIRIIGGGGSDHVASSAGGPIRLYDSDGDNVVSGSQVVGIDRKTWEEWEYSDEDRDVPRDWGASWRPLFWSTFTSDLGLFIGGGAERFGFGFRKQPFASHVALRGGVSTSRATGRAEFRGRWNAQNSGRYWSLTARASGLDVLRFHGFGNDTPTGDDAEFFKVDQRRFVAEPVVGVELPSGWSLSGGLAASYSSEGDNAARRIENEEGLYGRGEFGQLGVVGGVRLDARDNPGAPMSGVLLAAAGRVYPRIGDVEETYARLEGEVRGYLGTGSWPGHVLAVRLGGTRLLGAFPWFDAAFVGGPSTLRGWDSDRFAGEQSAYGSLEARIHLGRAWLLIPGALGVYGFADVGRVWVDGDSPGGWHGGYGGGLSFGPLDPANTVSVGVGVSEEATRLVVAAGFGF